MTDAVLLTIDSGIARITLNRPERLNAFNDEMAEGWTRAAEAAVQSDEVQAIIIDAAGRAFCAGGDVQAMATMDDRGDMIQRLAHRINVGILALTESAKPVVAAAHGTTAGGGLGILLCSDYAVIGESSRVGSVYGGVGLTPDLSVSAQLAAAVGQRRALQLLLQERLLSAEEAVAWGIAAEKVADDDVRGRAEAIAAFWVQNAHAYGEAKRLIRSRPERSFTEQLAEEARTIGIASQSPEGDKRIRAFAAR
ncbi:enoyl-CoA hydratase/isomerase family protein [Leucobacter komagatae]|uniref:Enoyl-CoA hydratase n=1 Tax=Leucobacter komagatae TaxID=55969 RepID=A0A0D0H7U1_9MICO|nr:enoyl-CoA hydratase/isomerase family protein [Leucobacter komagatae]KIP53295.1 enoyl-CoA hydratase [Leucobacter komagatae]